MQSDPLGYEIEILNRKQAEEDFTLFSLLFRCDSFVMKTIPFTTSFSLNESYLALTKGALQDYAGSFGCRVKSAWKKAQVAQALSDYVLANIGSILARSSFWEVELFRDLVEAGPGKAVSREGELPVCPLPVALQCKFRRDGNDLYIAMADELREAMGDSPTALLKDESFRKRSERLQFCRGTLALMGMVPLPYLFDVLKDTYPEDTDDFRASVLCSPEIVFGFHTMMEDAEFPFVISPYVLEVYETPEDLAMEIRPKVQFKHFPKGRALAAGQLPRPSLALPEGAKLRRLLLSKGGLTASKADELLYELWLDKQDFSGSATSSIEVVKGYVSFRSFEDIQAVMDAVMDFVNAVPCWALLGNASTEIRRSEPMTRPTKIQIGPNMRAAGYTDEDVQSFVNAAFYGGVAESMISKVGRNDPCPCGSGLKFKNCYGKAN